MKPVLPLLVLASGAALAAVGLDWLWTGLDIVQVERGWSSVIAGATMLSAGLVIAALAAVIWRLEQAVAYVRQPRPEPHAHAAAATIPATTPDVRSPPADRPARDERAVVGRHVSGDTTYVMFADGSVEAQTPEGHVTFDSLDALRAYAEEREAAQERV